MKKLFFVLLAMALFAIPATAQTLPDDILDLALTEIATGDEWHFCSQAATNLTEAETTYTLANVTVTPGTGGADYTLQNDAVNGGRELILVAQDPITLTANGTATHICVVEAGVDFLGCAEINGGTGRAITDYTTETGNYDGNAKFQMRDIQ